MADSEHLLERARVPDGLVGLADLLEGEIPEVAVAGLPEAVLEARRAWIDGDGEGE